jgi:hypothetical protein
VSDTSWTRQELLARLADALGQTRAHPQRSLLDRVLAELEDIEARVKANEPLDEAFRQTLYFDAVATRELDDAAETHQAYLDLLSELAFHLDDSP